MRKLFFKKYLPSTTFADAFKLPNKDEVKNNFSPKHLRHRSNSGAGFTLVEILLYIVVFSSIIFTILGFSNLSLQSRLRDEAIAEVEGAGNMVTSIISQEIRNARSITSPTASSTASSLTLVMPDSNISPIIFQLSNGVIQMSERGLATTSITSSRVTASGLSFTNLSRSGTPGNIRFLFTLEHTNPSNISAFSYLQRFISSASLRNN